MGVVNGIKLGLAINSKLNQVTNKEDVIKMFLDSVEIKGQFTVVEWSRLGKELEIFGSGKG